MEIQHTPPTSRSRIRGALFGLAFGDALGARTEFISVEEILARWPPAGPQEPEGSPALVTDDTQMALAVGEALVNCMQEGSLSPTNATSALVREFVAWFKSPDNYRAPGRTCMLACQALNMGQPWLAATLAGSKGCGANMRVAPVAFAPAHLRAGLSQLQAVLTHGHPTGLAASDLTSLAIAELAAGISPSALPERLSAYCSTQLTNYREDWLGEHWQRPAVVSSAEFIRRGWEECLGVLKRLQDALETPDRDQDPCLATGDGWIAEEAFATGLLCFLLYPNDPVQALRRAAVTRGDSDSIACLTGAFAGAHHGERAWPEAWCERIEYRDRIERLAESLEDFSGWEQLSETVALAPEVARRARPQAPSTHLVAEVNGNRLELVITDITQERVDAIVTAANRLLAGGNQAGFGGGVDGAIHRAAGPDLLAACKALGGCAAGEAVSTAPGALPVRRVVHAVGPVYGSHAGDEARLLASAHRRSLEVAAADGCSSVAFPAISCGVYHYPLDQAAPVALGAVCDFLKSSAAVRLVRYCLFSTADYQAFARALTDLARTDPDLVLVEQQWSAE